MNVIFAGTPEFAVPTLDALVAAGHAISAVLTQPDRGAGRGRKRQPSPVKQRALAQGIPVLQPQTLRDDGVQTQLAALTPDLMVVVAYGLLLPRAVLDLPRHGCINVHASLLPRWRGAAPIARAIAAGDSQTGVTIMRMAKGLDTGDMLLQRTAPMTKTDTAKDLHDRLAAMGGDMLLDTLALIDSGQLAPQPQDDTQATYAAKLDKAEAQIDWQQPAEQLARRVRAYNPWPVAFSQLGKARVRIWQAQPVGQSPAAAPGTIVAAGDDGVDVATGEGVLRVTRLQWPGKRAMAAADVVRGRDLVGQRFG